MHAKVVPARLTLLLVVVRAAPVQVGVCHPRRGPIKYASDDPTHLVGAHSLKFISVATALYQNALSWWRRKKALSTAARPPRPAATAAKYTAKPGMPPVA